MTTEEMNEQAEKLWNDALDQEGMGDAVVYGAALFQQARQMMLMAEICSRLERLINVVERIEEHESNIAQMVEWMYRRERSR